MASGTPSVSRERRHRRRVPAARARSPSRWTSRAPSQVSVNYATADGNARPAATTRRRRRRRWCSRRARSSKTVFVNSARRRRLRIRRVLRPDAVERSQCDDRGSARPHGDRAERLATVAPPVDRRRRRSRRRKAGTYLEFDRRPERAVDAGGERQLQQQQRDRGSTAATTSRRPVRSCFSPAKRSTRAHSAARQPRREADRDLQRSICSARSTRLIGTPTAIGTILDNDGRPRPASSSTPAPAMPTFCVGRPGPMRSPAAVATTCSTASTASR